MKLPSLSEITILVYGEPKIGKSTLCSQFPDAYFCATEAGLKFLDVKKKNVTNWEEFLEFCSEVSLGEHKYKTIVVDTVDNLVQYCQGYVVDLHNSKVSKADKIAHISDIPHGRGWMFVTDEITRVLTKLSNLPYGLILVSHSSREKVETVNLKYDRWGISITGAGTKKAILNIPDMIFFIDIQLRDGKQRRVIKTKPSKNYLAGDRSGILDETLELSYAAIKEGFDKHRESK